MVFDIDPPTRAKSGPGTILFVPERCLIAVAAPAEARAILTAFSGSSALAEHPWQLTPLDDRFDLVVTGIGKANAAGAVARILDPTRHARVLSTGVAGSLPGSGQSIGAVIAGTHAVFADEGLQTETRFSDCAAMGFPLADFPGSAVPLDPGFLAALRPLSDAQGPIATVSTCSGTDGLAQTIRERTGALAEAMEGAAVALVARRLGFRAAELRVVSNTTGQRDAQRWDLRGALARLSDVMSALRDLRLPPLHQ
jgi:futalosine hydrolase